MLYCENFCTIIELSCHSKLSQFIYFLYYVNLTVRRIFRTLGVRQENLDLFYKIITRVLIVVWNQISELVDELRFVAMCCMDK